MTRVVRIGLVVVAVFLAVATSAAGAIFTQAPPAQTTDGAGPFTWTFVSDGEHAYSWVAYKLSTESDWHRCVAKGVVTIEDLPVGTYSIEISNDVDLEDWAARGLGNSLDAQACHMSPPPDSPYARRVSSFSVIAPTVITPPTTPVTVPTSPTTSPTTPSTSAPESSSPPSTVGGISAACRTARQTVRNIRGRYMEALRRAAAETSSSQRRFWRGVADHRRKSLEREMKAAKKRCGT